MHMLCIGTYQEKRGNVWSVPWSSGRKEPSQFSEECHAEILDSKHLLLHSHSNNPPPPPGTHLDPVTHTQQFSKGDWLQRTKASRSSRRSEASKQTRRWWWCCRLWTSCKSTWLEQNSKLHTLMAQQNSRTKTSMTVCSLAWVIVA